MPLGGNTQNGSVWASSDLGLDWWKRKWGFPGFSTHVCQLQLQSSLEAHECRPGPGRQLAASFLIPWFCDWGSWNPESQEMHVDCASAQQQAWAREYISPILQAWLYFPTLPLGLTVAVLQLLSHVLLFVCSAQASLSFTLSWVWVLGLRGRGKKNIVLRPSSWTALSWARHHFFPVLVSLS